MQFALERGPLRAQTWIMVSNGFRIFGYLIGLTALYAMWLDLSVTDEPSKVLGQFWFEHHASSLQITEAVVSRYVDPCGLIVPLGCEPFLWHPVMVTFLGWPTALVLLLLTGFFLGIARLMRGSGERKIRGRDLKRRGEK